jgi:hypothetical protein
MAALSASRMHDYSDEPATPLGSLSAKALLACPARVAHVHLSPASPVQPSPLVGLTDPLTPPELRPTHPQDAPPGGSTPKLHGELVGVLVPTPCARTHTKPKAARRGLPPGQERGARRVQALRAVHVRLLTHRPLHTGAERRGGALMAGAGGDGAVLACALRGARRST